MIERVQPRPQRDLSSPSSPWRTPRFWRGVMVVLAVGLVGWMLWRARGALVPFAIGALIVYLLAPLVARIEQQLPFAQRSPGLARTIAILVSYLLFFGGLALAGYILVPPLLEQAIQFVTNFPDYLRSLLQEVPHLSARLEQGLPPRLQIQIERQVESLVGLLFSITRPALLATVTAVSALFGFFSALVLLPFWIFYALRHERQALNWFYGLWPVQWQDDVRAIVHIIDRTFGAYIRGQLFLGVVIGTATGLAMWAIGLAQPLVLGLIAGVLELVPLLGPILSFLVIAIVALATDADKLLAVAIAFIVIQQLENNLLVPRVQGRAVQFNPAIVMLLLVIGGAIWGLLGTLLVVPIAAACRDVYRYLYHRLREAELANHSNGQQLD
ncbi:MAG: AI-2E family transporter [Thermorudis peleae]|nr:AI-2E family transporter [Thermorudis peleae]